jgi:hypothetical protein
VDAPADPSVRADLRAKALEALRAELAARRKQAGTPSGPERQAAAAALTHWLGDPDLTGTRPGLTRIGMPGAEQAAWDGVWADVRTMPAEVRKPLPPLQVAPPHLK